MLSFWSLTGKPRAGLPLGQRRSTEGRVQGRVQREGCKGEGMGRVLICKFFGVCNQAEHLLAFQFPFMLSLDTPPLGPPWPCPLPGVRDTGSVLVQTIKVGNGDPVPKEGGEGTLLDEMAFELGLMNMRC